MFDRRDFLKIGAAGISLNYLPNLKADDIHNKNKSVIWVWLGGGPTHFETFNARTDVPSDPYKPVPVNGVSSIHDSKYGIELGGGFVNLAKHMDKLNVVANFSHGDSSHRQATHWVNTAHYNPDRAQTANSKYPSHGSVISAVYGSNDKNGVPSYVTQSKIEGDDAAWLGGAYKGFDPRAKNNLFPQVKIERLDSRKGLLSSLDKIQIAGESGPAVDSYKDQAFNTIVGKAKKAFDETEWENQKEKYGNSSVGKQLWLANNLTKYGTKFVTIHYGGWDMHSNIQTALESRVPPLDLGLYGLISQLENENRLNDVLIVVTGEFGRTRLNANQGRDHWPAITPMLLVGGDYDSGRVIGTSDRQNYSPDSAPYGPIDLQSQIFDHMEMDKLQQRIDTSGRPRYLLEGEARDIL